MSFNAALSGLQVSSDWLSVLGNNIANASTIGYKKSRAEFSDVYAVGSLGAGTNAIGTGVKLASVPQQFTQGTISSADTNLDMAINGEGFFVLDEDGSRVYSRAGAFGLDKDGNISNSQRQKLTGFLTDVNGNITGAIGTLKIQSSSLDPQLTESVEIDLNLDASAKPPTAPFVPGFTPNNAPASNSFNNSTSTQIFDSLGNSHILTTYFVKAPAQRTWRVYVGIDGTDVTPAAATPPVGAPPQNYPAGNLAAPFTLVFDTAGKLVPNNIASPAQFYGSPPVDSSATAITNSGTLATLDLQDLVINGVPIPAATAVDNLSTTDALASSISIVSAINEKSAEHGVTATVNANTFTLLGGTYAGGALGGNELVINNVPIVGVATDRATTMALINAQTASTGVAATAGGGANDIVLTAVDGRNIQLETAGGGVGNNFTNFDLTGVALDRVQRGTYSLNTTNNQGITVGGNSPGDAALLAGPLAGIIQQSSDDISIPNWDPATGATSPQPIVISLAGSTQFSNPFAITSLTQDGYGVGRLTSVDVDPEGIITARYGNGQSQSLGQVALASFGNSQGLQSQGDTSWAETFASGVALLGAPGTSNLGLISSGSLEDSNVQLTEELVQLIVAQRNFQANAQTVRTADAITQTIINIR